MHITGIKRGKTIELPEELDLPDGCKIEVEVNIAETLSIDEKKEKMKELLSIPWEDPGDFFEIMEEIDRDRHTYFGRQIDLLDGEEE